MKRIASILIVAAFASATLFGCCPCKHLSTSVRDSVRVEVLQKVIKIHDTVCVVLRPESERVRTRDTTATAETSAARATASVSDGWLSLGIENKDTQIKTVIDTLVFIRDSIVYRYVDKTVKVEVPRPLTWWQQTQIRGFYMLLALLLVICRKQIANLIKKVIN